MDAITINGQEITFTPVPEFRQKSSLVFNEKAVEVSAPNKYSNGFEPYLRCKINAEQQAIVDQMITALNERYQAEQEARKTARAEAARKQIQAQEEKRAQFGNDVQIFD